MSMTDVPSLTTSQHFLPMGADFVPSTTHQRQPDESDYESSTAPNSGRQAMVPLPPLDGFYTTSPKNNMYKYHPPSINSQQTDYPDTSPSASWPNHRAGLDPKAPFWQSYNTEATKTDRDTTRGWTSSLDFLLIVTGLFSAVVTGFLVMETSPEPSDVFANSMVQFIVANSSHHLLEAVNIPPSLQRELYNWFSKPPSPSVISIAMVTLWSTSLTCTLTIFVYAFYVKFWLREYQRDLRNGSVYDCAQRRQARWDAMLKFKVEEWILFLPLLMHLAVIFFFAGFILKLWTYHRFAAYVQIVLSVLVFVVYAWATIWPAFKEMCPYHNPAMVMVPRILCGIWGYFAAGGRKILRRLPTRLSNWMVPEELDLEKGSVEAESSLPLYRAHPRTTREEQFIARNSKALTWNAVAWFLETSREASYVDLALRSIRTLPYAPRKAFELLSTRIPRSLFYKIVPDGEDIVSEGENDIRAVELSHAKALEVYECTLSFIHVLKCVAVDAGDSGANLAPLTCLSDTSSYTYAPLDETMMQAWAAYSTSPKETDHSLAYTLANKEQTWWPTRNFAALLSMETLFYYLYPNTKADDASPLHHMHFLLERHIEKGNVLNGRSLALLLDSLVYVLGRVKDEATRVKTLGVLLKLVVKLGGDDYLAFRPLASCFKLYLPSGDPASNVLRECMDAPRERFFGRGPGSGYRALLDALHITSREDIHAARLSDFVWAAFLFTSSTVSSESAASEPILRENYVVLANRLQPTTSHHLWAVFTAVYATSDYGSPSETVLRVLSQTLDHLTSQSDGSRDVIAQGIFNCLKTRLLNEIVTEEEKTSICRAVFRLLIGNISLDGTHFLVHSVAKHRWLDGLANVFESVKANIMVDAQELLDAWDSVDALEERDVFDLLRAIF